jgi:hypothetical protein
MAGDYIPASDAELIQFAANFASTLAPIVEDVGLVAEDATNLTNQKNVFQLMLTNHVNAQTAARAATQTKNTKREELVESIRSIARRIQAHPGLTDAHRGDLGITIPSSNQTSVGAPTTRPVLSIQTGNRLQHVINFQDEMTPTSRAKPAGVLGCEIFRHVGTNPPTSNDQYQFLSLDTATPFIANFSESDGGKTAYYIARWTNRAGDKGSWSAVASATIVA